MARKAGQRQEREEIRYLADASRERERFIIEPVKGQAERCARGANRPTGEVFDNVVVPVAFPPAASDAIH